MNTSSKVQPLNKRGNTLATTRRHNKIREGAPRLPDRIIIPYAKVLEAGRMQRIYSTEAVSLRAATPCEFRDSLFAYPKPKKMAESIVVEINNRIRQIKSPYINRDKPLQFTWEESTLNEAIYDIELMAIIDALEIVFLHYYNWAQQTIRQFEKIENQELQLQALKLKKNYETEKDLIKPALDNIKQKSPSNKKEICNLCSRVDEFIENITYELHSLKITNVIQQNKRKNAKDIVNQSLTKNQ